MMPSKKRKLNFDLDDYEVKQGGILQICKMLDNFSIQEAEGFLDPEKILGLAAIKLGLGFVENVLSVISVIPEESGPWRQEIACSLLTLLTGTEKLTTEKENILKIMLDSSIDHFFGQERNYNELFTRVIAGNSVKAETECDVATAAKRSHYATGTTARFLPFAGCITPPTKVCFFCNSDLQKHNKPSRVTYYLASGPLPFLKVELRCRTCNVNYGIVKYGNNSDGYQYYSSLGVVEASDAVYIDRLVMAMYTSLSHHAWVSAVGFSEAYNEAVRLHDNWMSRYDGHHRDNFKVFDWRMKQTASSVNNNTEPDECHHESDGHFLISLNRKSLQEGFWNDELHLEIIESKIKFRFYGADDREACMSEVERMRRESIYEHECFEGCKQRGCGKLLVTDGIWKLNYPICLYKVPITIDGMKINMPDACPNQPLHGKPFCQQHVDKLRHLGIPEDLLGFIKHFKDLEASEKSSVLEKICSLDMQLDNESHKALDDLSKVGTTLPTENGQCTTADAQGSMELLKHHPELAEIEENDLDIRCRKDTGEQKKARKWSRGYQFIIGGGGHIESFTPLYESESPSQVFIFLINFFKKKLVNVPYNTWNEIFIAYDNICNIERLKVARQDLPFPKPYNEIWHKLKKIIDSFHLKNHKREECHTKYHPKQLKDAYPDFNTQCCEQTFSWLGKFNRILCAMPKIHNNFFMHRLVKRRNLYNAYCYSNGTKPVLPSSKAPKTSF